MFKFIFALLLGGAIGFGGGIFVYPYIFLADIVANEQVYDAENKTVLATGQFIHADPDDPLHYGMGGLTLYQDMLHLEADFEVGPGPRFHVYLVPKPEIVQSSDVEGTMFVDLGRLKAFRGSQNFSVPAGVDLASYGNVVVWCAQFGVLISPAKLNFAS